MLCLPCVLLALEINLPVRDTNLPHPTQPIGPGDMTMLYENRFVIAVVP